MIPSDFTSGKTVLEQSEKAVAQTPLKGYFVPDAKRTASDRIFIRRKAYHPLWWNVVNSAFLQLTGSSRISCSMRFPGALLWQHLETKGGNQPQSRDHRAKISILQPPQTVPQREHTQKMALSRFFEVQMPSEFHDILCHYARTD